VDVHLPVESAVHQESKPAYRFGVDVELPDDALLPKFPAGSGCLRVKVPVSILRRFYEVPIVSRRRRYRHRSNS
jgi:hypothetical protein